MGTPVKKIRVLVVDDSSTFRLLLTRVLSQDPGIEVVGSAPDPYVAREKIVELRPDVITLDIEMPRMDGVTFLGKLTRHYPVRAVVISSLSVQGSEAALRALEAGAIDVMAKPSIEGPEGIRILATELVERVKTAAQAKVGMSAAAAQPAPGTPQTWKPAQLTLPGGYDRLVAIASSTGGTEALKRVLPLLPADVPPILLVQHMPPVFTRTYAEALQKLCRFEIREARDGDRIAPGLALMAPGDWHMEVEGPRNALRVRLHQAPHRHGVRPAADFLMSSVARCFGRDSIGLVLTGMGKDGAEGLLEMKKAGSFNLAQDEASCVVFGMPKVAIDKGAIERVVPLDQMARVLLEKLGQKREAA